VTGLTGGGQRRSSGARGLTLEEPRRCLIVDDEPGLRRLLVRLMEGDGFACTEAATAVDALAALAEAEAGLGDQANAEAHALRALDRAPQNATAHLVIGLVRMAQQRYPEARDALVAAAAADPRSPRPEYQLSLVYARLGDAAAAQQHVERYQQKLRDMEAAVKTLHQAGFSGGVQ
jgi:tetratricopeptide (TPR) repeat protein